MGEKSAARKNQKIVRTGCESIYDDELVDDVGISLYARVDSILMIATAATAETVEKAGELVLKQNLYFGNKTPAPGC